MSSSKLTSIAGKHVLSTFAGCLMFFEPVPSDDFLRSSLPVPLQASLPSDSTMGATTEDTGGANDAHDVDNTEAANVACLRRRRFFIGSHASQSAIWSHRDFGDLLSKATGVMKKFVVSVPSELRVTVYAIGESGVMSMQVEFTGRGKNFPTQSFRIVSGVKSP